MRTPQPDSHSQSHSDSRADSVTPATKPAIPRNAHRVTSLTSPQRTVVVKLLKEGSTRELHTVHDHQDLKLCWIRPDAIIIVENGELSHQNLEDGEYALLAEATVIRLHTHQKQGFVSMLSSGQSNLVQSVLNEDEFNVLQSIWLPKVKLTSAHAVVDSHQP